MHADELPPGAVGGATVAVEVALPAGKRGADALLRLRRDLQLDPGGALTVASMRACAGEAGAAAVAVPHAGGG
eukprot:76054-Chlamydomonas_euryale.AAC.1